jgi:hypothetical protein
MLLNYDMKNILIFIHYIISYDYTLTNVFTSLVLLCRNEKPVLPGPERTSTMVSRRRILSRSRDDLNLPEAPPAEEEDVWFSKDKLLKVRTFNKQSFKSIAYAFDACNAVNTK